jgi:hypothetical protein
MNREVESPHTEDVGRRRVLIDHNIEAAGGSLSLLL